MRMQLERELHRPEDGISGGTPKLRISVVFTTHEDTVIALCKAAKLAEGLNGAITLIAPVVVSCRFPAGALPVSMEWKQKQVRETAASTGVETEVLICVCNDEEEMLRRVLPPRSMVLVGGRGGLWPSEARRLVQRLRKMGHEAILAEGSH